MLSPSSCYYIVVVTMHAILLLGCCYYDNAATREATMVTSRCDDGITSHKQKKKKFTLKCGLGVWMRKGDSWRREVGARNLGTW
jgi:hypothetical protein